MVILLHDVDETPQRLPLRRLIEQLRAIVGVKTCDVLRVWTGYGAQIAALENELDQVAVVTMPIAALSSLATGVDEWFFDLDAKVTGQPIRFGLFDSSFLFLDAPDDVCRVVSAGFAHVQAAPAWQHRAVVFNGVVVDV